MKEFSHFTRAQNIKKFQEQEFDLLIIGGGITGAGAARDAALRGLRVALVEAHDFASGTSSRSSKLIHGGIRYLENFEFKLVFEALSERQKLFKIAPHLVHPLRFMIPLYKSGRVGMFKMGLGMWAYDALALFRAPKLHERLNAQESVERQPSLQKDDLLGSYIYSDAYMDDDRLVFETLRSANDAGALSASFVKALKADFEGGQIQSVRCQDTLTGQEFNIKCKHVISSVGPWTDELGENILSHWKKILRPTKGVHLTFSKNRFPLTSAVVMGAESRIVFGIPRHEMVIVGTTDTDYQKDPGQVTTDIDDVQYLLGVIATYFPQAQITKKDILASYEGVRPLVADGAAKEGKTSREHIIFSVKEGITFVAGGKYTTYRLMAEQVVQEALRFMKLSLPKPNTVAPLNPLVTEESRKLDPVLVTELKKSTSLKEDEILKLVDRHGQEAREIVQLGHQLSYWQLEALHAVRSTMCFNLVDFYTRRVPLFLSIENQGLQFLEEIMQVLQSELKWTAEESERQKSELRTYIDKELSWKKSNF